MIALENDFITVKRKKICTQKQRSPVASVPLNFDQGQNNFNPGQSSHVQINFDLSQNKLVDGQLTRAVDLLDFDQGHSTADEQNLLSFLPVDKITPNSLTPLSADSKVNSVSTIRLGSKDKKNLIGYSQAPPSRKGKKVSRPLNFSTERINRKNGQEACKQPEMEEELQILGPQKEQKHFSILTEVKETATNSPLLQLDAEDIFLPVFLNKEVSEIPSNSVSLQEEGSESNASTGFPNHFIQSYPLSSRNERSPETMIKEDKGETDPGSRKDIQQKVQEKEKIMANLNLSDGDSSSNFRPVPVETSDFIGRDLTARQSKEHSPTALKGIRAKKNRTMGAKGKKGAGLLKLLNHLKMGNSNKSSSDSSKRR